MCRITSCRRGRIASVQRLYSLTLRQGQAVQNKILDSVQVWSLVVTTMVLRRRSSC